MTNTYLAQLDGGYEGERELQADNVDDAILLACLWALCGKHLSRVTVTVFGPDGHRCECLGAN